MLSQHTASSFLKFPIAALLLLAFGGNAFAQNGAYFHQASGELRIYTGNSGHTVQVGLIVGYVTVLIDGNNYPVYSSGSTLLLPADVDWIDVQGGDGDDDIDLSLVSGAGTWTNFNGADVYLGDGDDTAEGTDFDDDFYDGGGDDTVNGNGGNDIAQGLEPIENFTQ